MGAVSWKGGGCLDLHFNLNLHLCGNEKTAGGEVQVGSPGGERRRGSSECERVGAGGESGPRGRGPGKEGSSVS